MQRLAVVLIVAMSIAWSGCGQGGRDAQATAPLATLDFRDVVRRAKDKVFPAVIFIKCLQETHESGRKVSREVAGSGVLISPQGQALTNWHVVDKAVEIRCLLHDGRPFDATVVGTDKDTDLALLQLKVPAEADPLPHAALGDSSGLKEGDFVMAMGAPWGLARSVSIGIVSCSKRFLPNQSEYSLWLQSDTSISPGNSGGPLVNTAGEVVGINSRAIVEGGDMGFAVPSNTIRHLTAQIREHGKVNWSWTGLQLQPLRDFDRNIRFEGTTGVIVAETDPDSPARGAGLQARDRILKVGDRPVTAMTEEDLPAIRRHLGLLAKGEPVRVELVRGGQPLSVELTPREKGEVEGEELDCPRWDLTVKAINRFDNPDLYFARKQGVFVYGIRQPGNAAAARVRQKDILLKIDDKEVRTLGDVRAIHKQALADLPGKHRAAFTVLRNGLLMQIVLDYARDFEKE